MKKSFSISKSWDNILENTGLNLAEKIYNEAIKSYTTPKKEDIFNAFKLTPFESIKVVIVGQDPYPNQTHAHGLAFSSLSEKCPQSLKNIFKVINKNFNSNYNFKKWELTEWAKQGVFLINTSLTFYDEKSQNKNIKLWKPFIDLVFEKISNTDKPITVMLWGNKAIERALNYFQNKNNILILTSTHPSPLSANKGNDCFINCNHFKACNEFLIEHNLTEINWFNL